MYGQVAVLIHLGRVRQNEVPERGGQTALAPAVSEEQLELRKVNALTV